MAKPKSFGELMDAATQLTNQPTAPAACPDCKHRYDDPRRRGVHPDDVGTVFCIKGCGCDCDNHRIPVAPQAAADAATLNEQSRIVDWLAHRCDYAPVCGNCTYCRVAKWITDSAAAPVPAQPREDEKIRSAAVRKDGVVYPCWAHCYSEIRRMNLDAPEDVMKFAEQGFVTSTGRFVDRKEALSIAATAGQIVFKHHPKDELLSEDTRPVPAQEQEVDSGEEKS